MTLTFCEQVGIGYWHRFRDADGVVTFQETSEAEYAALALPGSGQPYSAGKVWEGSFTGRKYNTPTGLLGEGEYAAEDDGTYSVGVGNGATRFVAAGSINGGIIDDGLFEAIRLSENGSLVYA